MEKRARETVDKCMRNMPPSDVPYDTVVLETVKDYIQKYLDRRERLGSDAASVALMNTSVAKEKRDEILANMRKT
jgi:hypothetical protein